MKPGEREHALFDVLEPPAGGSLALRRRIVAERRKRVRRRRGAAVVATASVFAAVLAAFGLSGVKHPPVSDLDFSLVRMRLGVQAIPEATVTIAAAARDNTAALQLPSSDERVALYLVASRANTVADTTRAGHLPPEEALP